MHIFFPFAAQLHPDSYPGSDPNDCPRDIDKEEYVLPVLFLDELCVFGDSSNGVLLRWLEIFIQCVMG